MKQKPQFLISTFATVRKNFLSILVVFAVLFALINVNQTPVQKVQQFSSHAREVFNLAALPEQYPHSELEVFGSQRQHGSNGNERHPVVPAWATIAEFRCSDAVSLKAKDFPHNSFAAKAYLSHNYPSHHFW